MNQTFSFERFSLLVSKHWAENKKRYVLSVLAFMSLIFVWFVFVMLTDNSDPLAKGLQEITFYFSLFLVGPFYASQFFNELGSKTKGANYLMVPASALEKLFCSLLYALVLFFIVFTLAFYLVDFLAVLTANAFHSSPVKAHVTNVFNIKEHGRNSDMGYYFLIIFLAVQSVSLLGSIYFPKYSYIKTAISLALLFLLFAFIEFKILMSFMPKGNFWGTGFQFLADGQSKIVQLPLWINDVLLSLIKYGFTIIFWFATYFRLKEKEV